MTNLSTEELQDILKSAKEMAFKGGEILTKYWGKLEKIKSKEYYWDLVSEADLESERVILEILHKQFPHHKTLSEESGVQGAITEEFVWMIDPIDGTTNYIHQFPMVCVSIGLVHNGIPVVGVVYNPILQELFYAASGLGTWFNDEKAHVSSVSTLENSLLATGFAYDRKNNPDNNYAEFCHLTNNSQGVRRLGSAALDLAYVAAGRLDGYWERGLRPWDLAAGIVLVKEAGGKVSNYEEGQADLYKGHVLATNGQIHHLLNKQLASVRKS